ncbi:hypothetical protein N8817_00005, partial [Flavobacteriaceae bacterium]|nr:hypothetical protein [Flavobacteriaceae bacterium]
RGIINHKSIRMKNFKTILIVTLILDIIQFIPLVLAKMGGEMKNQMISDFNIEGLASSAPALEVLDIMLYIFGFVYLGTVLSVLYTLRLKTLEGLKSATFVLFIVHLFWTLPDFVSLVSGSSAHPPIIIMALTLIPVIGLYYVSQKGELKS